MGAREAAEQAGLQTYRLITTEPWPRPEDCRERNGKLIWQGARTISTNIARTEDLAITFAQLHQRGSAAIVRFARRFGPLYLCEHRLPVTHIPPNTYRYALDDIPAQVWEALEPDDDGLDDLLSEPPVSYAELHLTGDSHSVDVPGLARSESLEDWAFWSKGAELLIHFTASCRLGRSPRLQQWERLEAWLSDFPREFNYDLVSKPSDERAARRAPGQAEAQWITATLLDAWLRWGDIRITRRWDQSPLGLQIRAETLFGAIAADLLYLSLTDGYVEFCTNCLQPFSPRQRRTRRGTDPYCQQPDCRRAISRNSKRRRLQEAPA